MRDVVIWPDNDKAGFEASESICKEIKGMGIKSLREVDRELLAREMPSKWDLADRLPDDKNPRFCADMILRANKKEALLKECIYISNIETELDHTNRKNELEF